MTISFSSTVANSLPSAVKETPTSQRKRKIDALITLVNESWAKEKDGIPLKKRNLISVEPESSKEALLQPLTRTLSAETVAYCQNLKQKMEEAMRRRQAPEVQAVNDRWKNLIAPNSPY